MTIRPPLDVVPPAMGRELARQTSDLVLFSVGDCKEAASEGVARLSGVRSFVIYSLRHTFLTRLGEAGCDAWTLARIAGHSSIAMSARYIHPSESAVMNAFDKLQAPELLLGGGQ